MTHLSACFDVEEGTDAGCVCGVLGDDTPVRRFTVLCGGCGRPYEHCACTRDDWLAQRRSEEGPPEPFPYKHDGAWWCEVCGWELVDGWCRCQQDPSQKDCE